MIRKGVRVEVPALSRSFPISMTAENAARFVGLSRPTIIRMIEREELAGYKSLKSDTWKVNTRSLCNYLGLESEISYVEL